MNKKHFDSPTWCRFTSVNKTKNCMFGSEAINYTHTLVYKRTSVRAALDTQLGWNPAKTHTYTNQKKKQSFIFLGGKTKYVARTCNFHYEHRRHWFVKGETTNRRLPSPRRQMELFISRVTVSHGQERRRCNVRVSRGSIIMLSPFLLISSGPQDVLNPFSPILLGYNLCTGPIQNDSLHVPGPICSCQE